MSRENRKHRPMARPGGHGGMGAGEKAKDFKGSLTRLIKSMGTYRIPLIITFIIAIASTISGTETIPIFTAAGRISLKTASIC